jgi:hypothetical protein
MDHLVAARCALSATASDHRVVTSHVGRRLRFRILQRLFHMLDEERLEILIVNTDILHLEARTAVRAFAELSACLLHTGDSRKHLLCVSKGELGREIE